MRSTTLSDLPYEKALVSTNSPLQDYDSSCNSGSESDGEIQSQTRMPSSNISTVTFKNESGDESLVNSIANSSMDSSVDSSVNLSPSNYPNYINPLMDLSHKHHSQLGKIASDSNCSVHNAPLFRTNNSMDPMDQMASTQLTNVNKEHDFKYVDNLKRGSSNTFDSENVITDDDIHGSDIPTSNEHENRIQNLHLRRRFVQPSTKSSPLTRSKSMPGISKAMYEKKKEDVTFLQYILQEFNLDLDTNRNEGWNDEALEALYRSPSSIRSGVYNFLRVPFYLERFIAFAMLICIDIFFYYTVLMPLRILFTLLKVILRKPLKISDICDVLRLLTTASAIFILMPLFNYSFLYHYIRGQSTLKLYVTYNMLELFDKMASAFGIDIQDAMYYSATKFYFDREMTVRERIFVVRDAILSILGYIVYLFIHTTILYVRIITLNVALNSSNNALFSLLLSNNFLELKKPIFKRFAKENVFQFSCHDATERFQLILFGIIISMQNARAAVFSGSEIVDIAYCIIVEVVVDFLKHGFIAKFNNISSSVYSTFLDKLCEDMTEDRLQDTFLDNMNISSRRLGFTPIPLVTITIYVTYLYFQATFKDIWSRTYCYFQIYITLILLKFLTNIFVIGYASRRRAKIERRRQTIALKLDTTNSQNEVTPSENESENGELNLTKIFRYALFGKRLPD